MLTQLYVCGRFLLAYISGTVTDSSGGAIPGANVAPENGVRVSKTGFQKSVQTRVSVVSGGERAVHVAMKIGQAQEALIGEGPTSLSIAGARPKGQPDSRKSPLDKICMPVEAHAALP